MNNQTSNKKNYLTAVIAGMLTVLFVFPTLLNMKLVSLPIMLLLFVLVPIAWIIGLALAAFLARFFPVFKQIGRFAVVGFLNTSIDFGVLNLLSLFTGLTAGVLVGGVNVPGFTLAAINSYFWNKFWVFKKDGEVTKAEYKDFFTFILVTIFGVFINSGVVILVTTYISPFGILSSEQWLNIAKVFATVFSLMWNFVGYKFIVFKK